jgi:hypothetical protein
MLSPLVHPEPVFTIQGFNPSPFSRAPAWVEFRDASPLAARIADALSTKKMGSAGISDILIVPKIGDCLKLSSSR